MFFLFFASFAFAGDDLNKEDDRKIVYKQKTEIDFESLEVAGAIVRPSSALILERKSATFNPLIKLRTNWSDMIEESTEEMR